MIEKKYPSFQKKLVLSEQESQRVKKVLLVVGKMGHGKSSFIRTLIAAHNTENPCIVEGIPLVKAGGKSVTLEPALYRVDPSHRLTFDDEPLYVLDTEGLDSDDFVSLILEEADLFVQQQKLQIVGIAYVINLVAGREQGKNGESYIKKFLNLIKLVPKYKKQLLFCVASNWFKCAQYEEESAQSKNTLKQLLTKLEMPESVYQKTVFWDSGPSTEKGYEKFIKKMSEEERQIIENQWIQLSKNINYQIQNACPFQQYLRYYQKFERQLDKTIQEYKFQKSDKLCDENFYYEFKAVVGTQNKGFFQLLKEKYSKINSFIGGVIQTPSIVFYAVRQYIDGSTKVDCNSLENDEEKRYLRAQYKLKQRLIFRQKQSVYRNIFTNKKHILIDQQGRMKLLSDIPFVQKICVFDSLNNLIGDLTLQKQIYLRINTKERGNQVQLTFQVDAWILSFESFQRLYLEVVQKVYSEQISLD